MTGDYCQSCGNHPGMGDTCDFCGLSNPDVDRVGGACGMCGDPMQVEDHSYCLNCGVTPLDDDAERCEDCGGQLHRSGAEWCPLCDKEEDEEEISAHGTDNPTVLPFSDPAMLRYYRQLTKWKV